MMQTPDFEPLAQNAHFLGGGRMKEWTEIFREFVTS